jgi:hypothetical protein
VTSDEENVDVAVVGSKLKEDVFRAVPLMDYFPYEIFAVIQAKTDWPFVCFRPRITLKNEHLFFRGIIHFDGAGIEFALFRYAQA